MADAVVVKKKKKKKITGAASSETTTETRMSDIIGRAIVIPALCVCSQREM